MVRVKRVGPYKLLNDIGSGAYGQVFKCLDTRNQELRAIKKFELHRLPGNSIERAGHLDSLRKEVEILKRFDSDYIVKCYGDMETENNYYIVLEYCDGGTLKSKLGVGEHEALRYVRQIVAAMKAMYGLRVLHRDLKPDNILLSDKSARPIVKIGDFGTARAMLPQELATMQVGTLPYMAPEVLIPSPDRQYDVKADIWSLGVITYQLITGQLPYEHDKLQDETFYIKILEKMEVIPSDMTRKLLTNIFQINPEKRISFEQLCDHEVITGHICDRAFALLPRINDEESMDRALRLMEVAKKGKVKHPFLLYLKVCQLLANRRDGLFVQALRDAEKWVYRSDWESYTTDRLFIELAVKLCQEACKGMNPNIKEEYHAALALLDLVKDYPFLHDFRAKILEHLRTFDR